MLKNKSEHLLKSYPNFKDFTVHLKINMLID